MSKACVDKNPAEQTRNPALVQLLEMLQNDNTKPELMKKLVEGAPCADIFDGFLECENTRKIKQAEFYFESLEEYFKALDWNVSYINKDSKLYAIGFSVNDIPLKIMVYVDTNEESVTITTILPVTCIKEYYMLMGSKLSRLNSDIKYGAFRLDEDDGEITYRLSYSISCETFNRRIFVRYLDCCLMTPSEHFETIRTIATGSLSREEKVELLENINNQRMILLLS